MIKGTYVFYENGTEIARSSNVITKFGKRFLTNFIAGNVNTSSKDMAFGVDGSTASQDNTRLGFEFYRLPVLFGSTDIQTSTAGSVTTTTYTVIYKTTLPQDVVGEIYEVGIYPSTRSSSNNFDSKYISDFDDSLSWEDSSENNPLSIGEDYRIGGNVLRMTAAASSSREYKSNIVGLDLSGYSSSDTIRIAYNKEDNNLASIKIRLYSEPTKYYEATVTPTSGIGYRFSNDIPLSQFFSGASVQSPDAKNINQVGIIVTSTSGGSCAIGMDGLRINDEDTFDPNFGLISRTASLTASPLLSKVAGRQVDVEYRLDLEF